jgi:hypothetical protein
LAGAVQSDHHLNQAARLLNRPSTRRYGRAEALRRSMMAMLDLENPPEFAQPST